MKTLFVSLIIVCTFFLSGYTQNIVFSENFENVTPPALPSGWTQEKVVGGPGGSLINWETKTGGHQGNPPEAFQGNYNAIFQYESSGGQATKLITPVINNIDEIIKPELRFAHAQDIWWDDIDYWDQLKVYYKRGADSSWVLLDEFLNPVEDWIYRSILLPDSSLSSTYYIAFEGITGYGHGVCIDSVYIVETGVEPKYIESVTVNQASTNFIPTGKNNNPIIRVDFQVDGNDGTLILDSLAVKSLNTSDDIIKSNGIKLFATDDTIFNTASLIGTSNFSDGIAIFDNLNYDIPRNLSSVWITYDITDENASDIHGQTADAYIQESAIKINNSYYPFTDKSPAGNRTIFESIFSDDFETDKGWRFTGEFERDIPQGLGGSVTGISGFKGKPDPEEAYSGQYVIGTDLIDDGHYVNNLTDTAYVAEMPNFNAKYYRDIKLSFYRWLNIDTFDDSKILTSSDGENWNQVWLNTATSNTENLWSLHTYNLSSYLEREELARIMFSLGPTNNINTYSGWNIDDVVVTGNYIAKDVGVSNWLAPLGGCGHTDEEYVEITISNYAGEPMTDPLPVSYSFDGGITIKYDTINETIPVDGSINYTIDKPVDLTTPGWYNNVYATTHLAGDEDNSNNKFDTTLFITPTYTLPYSENFETNDGYYLTGGTNSTWEYGTPAGTLIDTASSGTKAWVTNLDGNYVTNENSYIESPCFNFGGADSIIFEFKSIGISEDQTDGLTVMYSFNAGETWSPLPNKHDYYWNWYNEENISTLGLPGIDSVGGEWLTFRQLLPSEFSNESLVKFRFVFASDESTTEEGFGIDDIKIYKAPYDLGVSSMDYPYNRCEWEDTTHVKVWVENYGPTAVQSGTDIPLVMKFNSSTTKDTLTLTEDLAVDDSVLFTFGSTVDMSYAGDYNFTIYTKLESNSFFYNDTLSNDSLVTTVSVLGMPRYNPFPVQIGDNPVDTFLVAGTGYSNYNWSGGGNPDVIAPQDTLYVDAAGWYHVTVTNEEGCTAIDSVEVINSEIDLSMDTLFTELVDSCERNVLTDISVLIKNNSLNEFNAGDSLAVAYQVNNEPIVRDTLILQDTLTTTDTGDTVRFTFNDPADFTTPDNYTLKVFTDYQKDLDHSDDTISVTFNTWGYVEIDMAYDTIYSSQADTLKIGTTPGYTDYEWSTAEITDTISPPDNVSRWYKVDVEDDNICGSDSDSVYVETYDMGITVINNPEDACEDVVSPNTSINVTIKNFSGNTYASDDTVRVYYNFDNTGWHHNTITLGSTLNPNSTITKNIGTVDPTEVGAHTLKVYTSAQIDANTSNDLYELEFETWPLPDVELAYDTIFTTKADTVILAAQEGFASYLWNTGETNDTLYVTDKKTKTYSVEVTDVNGCGTDSDSTIIISYNVGISSLVSPKSACEHGENESVRIAVTNYGRDTLDSGTQIPVTLEFEYGEPVNETLTLSGDLNPSGTAYYTFNEQLDLSTAKTYHFKVYTGFELDANQTNDTLVDVRKTFGNPNIELGDDIYTTLADTVILVADPGYNNYSWNNGTNNDSLEVSYPASNNYSVTVTDINGCSTIDDINIYTYDVKATALEAPVSQCELTNAEEVTITVQNNSHDTLLSGETISASYILNSGTPITETFDLTETLYPDSTVDYTFTQTADLSVNQTHEFTLFAKLVDIDVALEDTINASVDFQKTELDLGGDVNVGTEEYTIDAGAEFSTYLWFDESTSQTYTVNINYQTPNKYYAVTVTNSFGCEDADSIMVTFDLEPDIAVTQMLSPESTCWIDGETYPVEIEITNEGVIDLTTGTEIEVGYISDNGDPVTESYALTSDLEASASFNFTFADEISFPSGKEYVIKTFAKLTADENIANDTLPETVNISAPEISLSPYDTIYFEDQVTLNPGNWDQYLWQNGSTNQNFTVTSEGWYSVTVTDEIGCQASDSVYCAKYDPNSIDNLINGDGYSITYYPNPVSEELKIEVNAHKTQDIYIELVNTHGQVIYNTKLSRVRDVVERINVNPYPNGVYYIRFRINNEFFVRKIIFQ